MLAKAFDQSEIEIMSLAHERAVEFLSYGEGSADPLLREHVASDIVMLSRAMPEVRFVELANAAILRYRHRQAALKFSRARAAI
ncbi:MAG TPA: hypothetical protein VHD34_02830 [Xanthobacteraceae bacterium]|nr:hypothetical protein [Xanthobacteraceae bacterium]